MKQRPAGILTTVAAFLLAVAASAFALFAPTGAGQTEGGTVRASPQGVEVSTTETLADGQLVVRETITYPSGRRQTRTYTRPAPPVERTSLLEEEPDAIIPVVAVALTLTGLPLALNGTRLRMPARFVAALVLLAGSFVGGASVGLFYLPSAIAMTIAATRG